MADDLLKLMQQWLTQLNAQSMAPDDMAQWNLWQQAFAQMQPFTAADTPLQQAELIALLTRQSLEFTRFAEQILALLDKTESKAELSLILNQFHDHLRRLTHDWILQRWQLPEQLGALFKTHSFQDDLLLDNPFIHGLKSLLNSPALLGLNQRLQRQLQYGVDLLIEYEQALAEYSGHYTDINNAATLAFLHHIDSSEPAINSLGQLHDLWVESYEASYAVRIRSDGYRDAHGRISNAVMQIRLFLQELRNQQLQQLGIPSSDLIELLVERLNKQRKQIKQLQKEVTLLPELMTELTELRQRLDRFTSTTPGQDTPADTVDGQDRA